MSDGPDAAAVKTNGQLWLVLMLSASIVSLGGVLWRLVRVLRTTDEIEHGFDEMRETVTNIPQRPRVATVEVANEVDGNVFVRFDYEPTDLGTVTAVELFDAADRNLAMLFGLRKPDRPELPEWREHVARLERLAS